MTDQVYSFDPAAGGPLELLQDGIDRPLRWAAWRPDGSSCLLVGNRGSAVLFDPAASLRAGAQAFSVVDTKTKHNLRGVAFSPDGKQALLVGNRGAVLLYSGGAIRELPSPTHENLRRVAWHPDGTSALIVGNRGTVLRYEHDMLTPVPGDRAHTLRAVAWRPDGAYALVGAYASSWAGYPRPHALYKCDGVYLQALLTSDVEDDFVAIDWHPDGRRALIAGYAYNPSVSLRGGENTSSNKLLIYDGEGFAYQPVEAAASLLGAAWHPSGEYALLCGEGGFLLRYTDPSASLRAGAEIEQLDSGTKDNLVGPFWRPAARGAPDGSRALFLRGPGERVYTV